jgi:hypothetical protein
MSIASMDSDASGACPCDVRAASRSRRLSSARWRVRTRFVTTRASHGRSGRSPSGGDLSAATQASWTRSSAVDASATSDRASFRSHNDCASISSVVARTARGSDPLEASIVAIFHSAERGGVGRNRRKPWPG